MHRDYPNKAIIVGATSAIAMEAGRRLASKNCQVVISARNPGRERLIVADLSQFGSYPAIPAGTGTPEELWDRHGHSCELLLIACGHLPGPPDLTGPEELEETFQANTLIPIRWCQAAATDIKRQRGAIAIIGSVAGDRGRKSNHIYGAAKAAIETYCEGLSHRLYPGAEVCLIKPGFTRTAMTAHAPASKLTVEPGVVADDILRAIQTGRSKTYSPARWAHIMRLIRWLPNKILWRTEL